MDKLNLELKYFLKSFEKSKSIAAKCNAFGISRDVYKSAIQEFTDRMEKDSLDFLTHHDLSLHLEANSNF